MRSEQDLVEGVKQQDTGIFEEFVRRYQQRVYFTSLRMMGKREDALDAAQDVFLKIWKYAPKLQETVVLERWVYRVTINACIDRLRNRNAHDSHINKNNVLMFSLAEPGMNPRDYARRMEDLGNVRKAMDGLTERQRAIFVLRHFQNLKIKEIAEVMSMPLGTVKATLHQAFYKLKELLSDVVVEQPERKIDDTEQIG
jgi:RNA polymerase sigma-70 factor, ECF subfamily